MWRERDASLARARYSTYVRSVDGQYCRLCRVQLPGAAPEPSFTYKGFQRLSGSSQPAQRAASKAERFRARAASGPRLLSFQGRFKTRHSLISVPPRGSYMTTGGRFGATTWAISDRQSGAFCRPRVPDGPTPDAPDCIADQDLRKFRPGAEQKLRARARFPIVAFGQAPKVAFRPSPHPRIRWTVASSGRASCAHGHTRPLPPRVPKCPTKC